VKRFLPLLLALALVPMPAFARAKKKTRPQAATLPFRAYQGSSSASLVPVAWGEGKPTPVLVVYDDRDAWEGMISKYPARFITPMAAGTRADFDGLYGPIDFETEIYGEWIWGEKPSTGYGIRLERIEDGNPVRCYLKTRSPGTRDVTAQALTTPSFSAGLPRRLAGKPIVSYVDGRKTEFRLLRNPKPGADGRISVP
jgi:hypothetical protein